MWPTYSSLPHRLAPGPHVIEVSEKYTSGKKSKHFEYKRGETVYIDINRVEFEYHDFGEAVLTDLKRGTSVFSVDVHCEMPKKFNELPLIFWRDENWMVKPETRGQFHQVINENIGQKYQVIQFLINMND
jgi:hypothetical protein